MEIVKEYTGLKIPTYALSYLVNGDDSGIELEDKKAIDKYMDGFYAQVQDGEHLIFAIESLPCPNCNGDDSDVCETCDGEGRISQDDSYFTWHPEFGLACDVMDCTILILR